MPTPLVVSTDIFALLQTASNAAARVSINVDKRTAVADVNYTILATDKVVSWTSITAARVATLPAASSVNAGQEFIIGDMSGSCSVANTITITRAGSDTIDGATTEVIAAAYGKRRLISDGVSAWGFDKGVARIGQVNTFTMAQTFSTVARTSGSASFFTITTPADATLAASTECIGVSKTAATRQFATGALTTQREVVFAAPTYGFVGASTLSDAVNVYAAEPIAGTNATFTGKWGIEAQSIRINGRTTASGGGGYSRMLISDPDTPARAGSKYDMTSGINSIGTLDVTYGSTAWQYSLIASASYPTYLDGSIVYIRGGGTVALTISGANTALSGTLTVAGDVLLGKTITAGGTTGAQTINKTSGRVNFAAAATSLVVTNSLVTANSIIHCTIATNDATAAILRVVAGSGSFTIYLGTAPTAETAVNFTVTN